MSTSTADVFSAAANAIWKVTRPINSTLPQGRLPSPKWAPGPLLKRGQRKPMDQGVPRKTLSLCPDCNNEAVEAVLQGEMNITAFRDNPGIVEAAIVEDGGRILMRKACDRHGPFEDALSNHPGFFQKMERLSFGRDFACVDDCNVHDHGPNSTRSGRGTSLIVDLTNRCNMMCSPCFMDANTASYVHELDTEDIKVIFNNARSEEHTSELQSQSNLVCRLLLEKKKTCDGPYLLIIRSTMLHIKTDQLPRCADSNRKPDHSRPVPRIIHAIASLTWLCTTPTLIR